MIKEINKILKDNSYETTDDYNEEVCVIDVTSKDQRKELAEEIVKKLSIHIVNQQRELLIDCVDHCYNIDNYKFRTTEYKVDNYLESINYG
ncbi:hypothetical protein Harreka1_62 [Olleya phage Harreka_1]|uniref:Uncharacterized protein n=1 Tax=Olleya phage Harreka_1 TaxID=2745673 RepID=A0A8E4ZL28_9CAUD|nr:hypothetical protein M1M26_gp62 [Olleya phage Harreka_1]QQV90469.1 hypothetical protein Harreka1_62 [Olleya phage Harreka_1]